MLLLAIEKGTSRKDELSAGELKDLDIIKQARSNMPERHFSKRILDVQPVNPKSPATLGAGLRELIFWVAPYSVSES